MSIYNNMAGIKTLFYSIINEKASVAVVSFIKCMSKIKIIIGCLGNRKPYIYRWYIKKTKTIRINIKQCLMIIDKRDCYILIIFAYGNINRCIIKDIAFNIIINIITPSWYSRRMDTSLTAAKTKTHAHIIKIIRLIMFRHFSFFSFSVKSEIRFVWFCFR